MTGPLFFVDRSLGRHRVPNVRREDRWSLVTPAEHYGIPADEAVAEVDRLELAGRNRWPVLMKNERSGIDPPSAAVRAHGVRGFYLTSGNLASQKMGEVIIANRDVIWRLAVEAGPAPLRRLPRCRTSD